MSSKITEPKISINVEPIYVNKRWAIRENITLTGRVIDNGGLSALLTLNEQIDNIYSQQTSTLTIGSLIRQNVFLRSVSFQESDYISSVEYTVVFISYPPESFVEQGILDPINEWSFVEDNPSQVTITHRVSARGINTSNLDGSALENAKQWVQSLVGKNETNVDINLPLFINIPNNNFVLESRIENKNRVEGIYSIDEVYKFDLLNEQKAIIEYSVDISEPKSGFLEASINGEFKGGLNTTQEDLGNIFNNFNFFQEIKKYTLNGEFDLNDLNEVPKSRSVEEFKDQKKISFNITYDNNVGEEEDSQVSLDIKSTSEKGENNVTTLTINGSVFGRLKLKNKWEKILSYYQKNLNIFINENLLFLVEKFYTGENEINKEPTSRSVIENKFDGTIDFAITFNDKESPPDGFEDFDYRINITPSFYIAKSIGLVGKKHIEETEDEYVIQSMGHYSRELLNISGTATIKDELTISEGILIIQSEIEEIAADYIKTNSREKDRKISYSPINGKNIQFSYSWDYDSLPINSKDDLEIFKG